MGTSPPTEPAHTDTDPQAEENELTQPTSKQEQALLAVLNDPLFADDEYLQLKCGELIENRDILSHVLAMSLARGTLGSNISNIPKGRSIEQLMSVVTEWARSFTADQIQALVLEATKIAIECKEALEQALFANPGKWRENLLKAAQMRADVEYVLDLTHWITQWYQEVSFVELMQIVDEIDNIGEPQRETLPHVEYDEQLERARINAPWGWWGLVNIPQTSRSSRRQLSALNQHNRLRQPPIQTELQEGIRDRANGVNITF